MCKKNNILITWISSWVWENLWNFLIEKNNIIWISRKKAENNKIESYKIDLSKKIEIEYFCDNIIEQNYEFDVLILNAWIWEFWNFEENDLDKYENIINVNLLANIRLLKMLEKNISKKTKIIFIWSIISKKFMKWASVYQASKFWLRWLAWGLKQEWKKVFIINPKIVDTDFHKDKIDLWKKYPETKLEDILKVVKNIINGEEKRFEIDL
jgi:short-subunit dehydrogenase